MSTRRCFLLVDTELPESLSSRKLMLEAVKFNVLSAHSGEEGLAMLERFPRVDGVLVHTDVAGRIPFYEVAERVKQSDPKLFVLALAPAGYEGCDHCDEVISSHDPKKLVDFLLERFGPEPEMRVKG